ncbi:SMI1/KNR4 family protein [Pectobacterium polaris]|uniref:SMI1/KNR4 family protein n=1 Tax=Pectobacterium polaris TaxID=2042057 RepID=A0AAW4P5X4_9GAMM|nr:SMI1/KNR4 family protein [Pectobacterium polaris]ASY81386.1 SMI1/KNR4 family protein [Pectobacterium polaris]MBW5894826.1 SMI1/KNR4 family protein [Pectobacterium polaris]MCA6943900.1 SMI1/KNR4 family protein [Pectobacterium polaris]MCA6957103.1 SMI1/KNR4 family protein [Pectobacterium polaris]MCL6362609.1 SMI1/KNR4 family protein [Pectobacterium polaris]
MNKIKVMKKLADIEKILGKELPIVYKKFLSEEVGEKEAYEIRNTRGDLVYIYNYHDVIERNKTYTIQDVEPNYFLIGQDGDIGYFIYLDDKNDKIYSLDLGAIGSLDMDEEAKDIYNLRA